MDMSLSKLQELVMDREAWVLQSMGSQRVGHDWATELDWTDSTAGLFIFISLLSEIKYWPPAQKDAGVCVIYHWLVKVKSRNPASEKLSPSLYPKVPQPSKVPQSSKLHWVLNLLKNDL